MYQKFSSIKSSNVIEWIGYYILFIYGNFLSGSLLLRVIVIKHFMFVLYLSSLYLAKNIYGGSRCSKNLEASNIIYHTDVNKNFKYRTLIISEFFLMLILGYFFLNTKNLIILLTSFLIGLFYFVPPLRFRERPIIDLLSYSFSYIVYIIFFSNIDLICDHLDLLLTIMLYSFIIILRKEIEDNEHCMNNALNTTVARLGNRYGYLIMYIFIFLMYLSAILTIKASEFVVFTATSILLLVISTLTDISRRDKMMIVDLYIIVFLIEYLMK